MAVRSFFRAALVADHGRLDRIEVRDFKIKHSFTARATGEEIPESFPEAVTETNRCTGRPKPKRQLNQRLP
jgi:hypothetical protein